MTTIQDLERRLNRAQAELAQVKSNARLLSFRLDNTSLEGDSLRVKAGVSDAIRTDGAIVGIANRIARIGEADNFIGLSQSRQSFFVGGTEMLRLYSGNQDVIKLGDGSDIDINFNGMMFMSGETGSFYVGQPFSNSGMSIGITIHQGENDDEALAFKSSNVAHGMTSIAETDTFGYISKMSPQPDLGGMLLQGLHEGTRAITLRGSGTIDHLYKDTVSVGYIGLYAQKKSGTTAGSCGPNANLVVIRNDLTTRWILDAEGTAHHVPSSDESIDIISVSVTNTPTFGWNQSENKFNFDKGVIIASESFIGPAATSGNFSNSNMGIGLTINQETDDDEIIALKSSDVAHGMTSESETDTFGLFKKSSGALGGLVLHGFHEGTQALSIIGSGVTDNTTKQTDSAAYVTITAQKKSGTSITDAGSNANLLAIKNNATVRWILNAEGDQFYGGTDGGSISDHLDDTHLLSGFRAVMSPTDSPAHRRFKGFIRETEGILVQQGVLTAPLSKGGLVSDTGLKGLLIDAIIQLKSIAMQSNDKIVQLSSRIAQLEAQLNA